MDFAKAFDKVCHASLAVKLKGKGVDGKVLGWIKNWLFGRKQRVVVEGQWSELEEVVCCKNRCLEERSSMCLSKT